MIKRRELLCKRRRYQTNGLAWLQLANELQNATRVGGFNQRLHHPSRDGLWLIATHDQPRYSNGAVDAAPLMTTQIEDDE